MTSPAGKPEPGLRGLQAWPTMLFFRTWEDHQRHRDAIVARLRELQAGQRRPIDSGVAPAMKSAAGLSEGGFDLLRDPQPSLGELRRFIESSVATAACVANGSEAAAKEIAVTIVDSWYHITNDGGFHDAHHHHGCSWCGIYYLQAGESGRTPGGGAPNGASRFYSPLLTGGQYRDYGNRYLAGSLDFPLEDGLLLIFPSYLLHSGLPYRGSHDRIVIAFNSRVHLRPGSPLAARLGGQPAAVTPDRPPS